MKPYYQDNYVTIYHGDCREILPELPKVDLVLTDPPYGMAWDGKITCGPTGHGKRGATGSNYGKTITGDDVPFDTTHLLSYPRAIIFGWVHFADKLPTGTALVWIKKLDTAFGSFLSDADIAWMKGGHGVYCYRDITMRAHALEQYHPSQKPIPLLMWCMLKAGGDGLVLDPYMGSGSTLVAAKKLNRKCIGIEIEEKYCEIAANRCRQMVMELGL